uniref:Uncharacterized protein n=1 Tax=Arundo donax TaxID=35708 RepID=A0A0A9EG31_ARUDO
MPPSWRRTPEAAVATSGTSSWHSRTRRARRWGCGR